MALPLISIAGIISCLAIALSVFGMTVSRLFRWRWILQQGPGICAVIGLAGTILFLELWNFFYPVSHSSVAVLAAVTLVFALIFRRTLLATVRAWIRRRSIVVSVLLLLLLFTVSLFGLGPSEYRHFDTGLYYLNSIRWAHEFPVIPGLANLHSRLGYNQSLFLFVAFLSSAGNLGLARACQLVNPLFVFVCGWAILDQLRLNLTTAKAMRIRLYAILLLCPLFFLGSHILISAATADIAAAGFALAGSLAFVSCLEETAARNASPAGNWLLVVTVCVCTLIKLKLSYAVLGGIALFFATIVLLVFRRNFVSAWIQAGVLAIILVVPWSVRGVVLSGFPFYPSTVIRFRTDWATPKRAADSERRWIASWAKEPNEDPVNVLGNNAWFTPWLERNVQDPENILLFVFVTGGLVALVLSLVLPTKREHEIVAALLMGQSLLAVFFWFQTAPEPRFGYASLLLVYVSGFYAFVSAILGFSNARASVCACVIAFGSILLISIPQFRAIENCDKKFPHGFPEAQLKYKITDSGLVVGVPVDSLAWNNGLIATPYFNRHLALRGRDVRDGFRINGTAPKTQQKPAK
ncbi:MAG TPA: hypothetical protein VHS80_04150 [Chthoniobacterales bacterium]|jgi:hypothetical protein|nr:hypothetical protein [Chthoniobacterales bacterium]